ncbi:solute symporter family protein [Actinacidiphila oryziradicis]|jgi:cation/acetate symporter|uniref:Cation acetate symporter n=1 Tax=Actinacidiphila oryziradicis TaxID=2571141 RepID=A0A4U0SK94_9ACTN|nr:cation acetate symporter [Actinacidiphila oryziradicis]TKA09408.1 cation acetate symporter [Actinacidiphila oryziradicis]
MSGDHQGLALVLFTSFVSVTLGITAWAGRRRSSSVEFFAGGRLFSPMENGFAIAGDYISAGSFLGVSGLIAMVGYDGMLYCVGFLVGFLVVLMLVAELVRNVGRFTLADVLSARMRERRVRIAAGASSVVVSVIYLVAQMVGAGSLVSLLLGGQSAAARTWTVIGVGGLMVFYVVFGGMRATTWIQIVKAVLLMGGSIALVVLLVVRFHGDLGGLLRSAADGSGQGKAFLAPGLQYGVDWTSRLDFMSLGLALVLGTAGLPHILSRFYTVPTARSARRSVVWAIGLIGSFYLMTITLGFGAAALVGSDAVRASNRAGNTAVPLLALNLGGGAGSTEGTVLFAVVGAVAFATILAVVAGITLASSASVAHDLYATLRRSRRNTRNGKNSRHAKREAHNEPGEREEHEEVKVARIAAIGIGALSITLSLFAQGQNVAFLVGLAFAVAASANLPALLYTLFWRRFTTRGALWAVYGGLVPSVLLVVLSPVVSGSPGSVVPGVDFQVFPLQNPGLVSIPMGFLAGWLGTVLSPVPADEGRHAEAEVRALTGAGAV